ncbi:lysophospholipid acyltransferase family protein [Seohaeicola nanhaiensis]|uniref:Lysophospholipid acyltransferase family protein n=1 Tax=Seohaeicola nanhaiensis TaxID=1387282 RepID=A0ABV9KJY6_9RHOB
MSLRRKIADSPRLNRALEAMIAGYVRFAYTTSRWERIGFEAMEDELRRGEPVIFCVWHQRLIMAPWMFDTGLGKFCSLTSSARAGMLVGSVLGRFGFDTVPMSSHKRHVALSREVLKRIADGYTIGIAVDGPRGPARVASTVPLVWARSTGKRIFVLSWSARRYLRAGSWDRFLLPLPFTQGVLICRPWSEEVPRGLDVAGTEELRLRLERALDDITDASDIAAGRHPEQR